MKNSICKGKSVKKLLRVKLQKVLSVRFVQKNTTKQQMLKNQRKVP